MEANFYHTRATVRQYLIETGTHPIALSFEATGRGGAVKRLMSCKMRKFDARTARRVLSTIRRNPDGIA